MNSAHKDSDGVSYPTTIGEGLPELAVIACSHGDEISGKVAINCLLRAQPSLERSVKFLIGNEKACRNAERFIDEDLNRAYPGDSKGDTYESKRATEILDDVSSCRIIDIHSTVSSPTPFVTLQRINSTTVSLARATGVNWAVDISLVEGGLISYVDGIALEVGPKGTPAAVDKANERLCNFFGAANVADWPAESSDPLLFKIYKRVGDGNEEFIGTNFEKVEKGEVYARKNGEEISAKEEFYPVLMSDSGYDGFLGFKAKLEGPISDVEE